MHAMLKSSVLLSALMQRCMLGVAGRGATGREIVEVMRRQAASFQASLPCYLLICHTLSFLSHHIPVYLLLRPIGHSDRRHCSVCGYDKAALLRRCTQSHEYYSQLNVLCLGLNASGATFTSHALIVATGADSRWLKVKGEYEYRGGGVSSCATCDGFLFRGQFWGFQLPS